MEIVNILFRKLRKTLTKEEDFFFQEWLKESKKNSAFYKQLLQLKSEGEGARKITFLDVDKAWKEVQRKAEKHKKVKTIPIYHTGWFKLTVAAASIALLISFGYNFINNNTTDVTQPPIIIENNIVAGTDKAILTLEDGKTIALEKGNSFKNEDVNSNGKQITYSSSSKKSKEKIKYHYLTIPRGGQFHIILADGTEVWLNSESQLRYPTSFVKGKERIVELVYGEAYFDVSSSTKNNGSKFKVLNQNQEIEVLGTEFNIKAYKDETNIYTTLVEGKVAVSALKTLKHLKPNEQLNLNLSNNTMQSYTVDVFRETSWRQGEFSFRETNLKAIMKVLSRWYNIDVDIKEKELENITFNGSLDKTLGIEKILAIITSNTNIKYSINDKKITLQLQEEQTI